MTNEDIVKDMVRLEEEIAGYEIKMDKIKLRIKKMEESRGEAEKLGSYAKYNILYKAIDLVLLDVK